MIKLFFSKKFEIIFVSFLILLFFLPNILAGKIPIPADAILGLYHPWRDVSIEGYDPQRFPTKNPLITDPVLQTYPWRNISFNNIKEGNLPLWNPYSFSGQPLLGNIQSSPFQIHNLLFFILPFKIAWAAQIIIPSILTGIFMCLFLRSLNISSASSIFGGVVLPFSGFFISWLTWGTVITTAMWLPLILLSINKIYEKKSAPWFLILVFSITQTFFSGHWQTAFYVCLASILFLVFKFYKSNDRINLTIVIISFVLAILISAPQIMPSLEFINLSARSVDQGYFPGRLDWFLPPQNLIQLLSPDFFGNPTTYNYWGVWNYSEFVSFLGIIPLALALLGIFNIKNKSVFFLFLALLSLIFALENPISKIPYTLEIPLISSMQPSRIIFLFVFSFSVLSAFGLEVFLLEKSKKKILIFPAVIFLSLAVLFIYSITQKGSFPIVGNINTANVATRNLILPIIFALAILLVSFLRIFKVPKNILLVTIFALTIVELFRFGHKFTPFSKTSWIFPETQTTQFLTNQKKPFRIITTDRRLMHPNTSAVYGIESVDGYDPLYLEKYGQLISSWLEQDPTANSASFNRIITPQKFDSQIADLLNIKFVLTFDELDSSKLKKVFEEGQTKIYQNNNLIPRAFFVEEVTKVNSDQEVLSLLLSETFDISKKAASQEFFFKNQNIYSSIDFITYADQSFTLKTSTGSLLPLVITNIHYPGWQAYLDGNEIAIKKVNFTFQAIMVPEGEHQIEFKFRPKSFYNGFYLSLAGITLTIFVSLFLWRRKYQ